VVLELGGALEVVLPAADYRSRKVTVEDAAVFDELMGHATTVRTLPFETSNRESYLGASEHLLSTTELMVAVWDGEAADGRGGTGDVVERARALSLPVTVVWPVGAAREVGETTA
jgi:hypothetical protein